MLLKASKAHYQVAKWYAEMARCKVVFTDYRLLPKNKYPVPVEDCYCTYQWTLDYADMLGINKDKIVVAGGSAGGNLAAAVTLMLWDRVRISPLGAMLIYPVTDRRMITESMKKFTDTPVLGCTTSKNVLECLFRKSGTQTGSICFTNRSRIIEAFSQRLYGSN